MDVTTVADDLVVIHDGLDVRRHDGLEAATEHDLDGVVVRTLPRPDGELLCRFATVNDVHFGETEAGRVDDHPEGPIRRAAPGAPPYPEVMNHAAAQEMADIDPVAVIVKGDLSVDGQPAEWEAFEACYRAPFGDRLHVVRGNHDAYRHQAEYAGDQRIELPGVTVALLDTAIPGATTGTLTTEQLDWLDDLCATADRPVFVMGHHQQWIGDGPDAKRSDDYFGLHPDASDALDSLADRRTGVIAYAAGHTHRHRVRPMATFERAVDRDRLHEGLPRYVGGVPGVRGRHHAGGAPHVDARGAGVERVVPRPVLRLRRRLRDLRARHPRRSLLHHLGALTCEPSLSW